MAIKQEADHFGCVQHLVNELEPEITPENLV